MDLTECLRRHLDSVSAIGRATCTAALFLRPLDERRLKGHAGRSHVETATFEGEKGGQRATDLGVEGAVRLVAQPCRKEGQPPRQMIAEELPLGFRADASLLQLFRVGGRAGSSLPRLHHEKSYELQFQRDMVGAFRPRPRWLQAESAVEPGDIRELLRAQ